MNISLSATGNAENVARATTNASGASPVLLTLIVALIVCAGIIWLQIFLSRKDNKWLGLILPAISLFLSLIAVFGIAALSVTTSSGVTIVEGSGKVIQEAVHENVTQNARGISSLALAVVSVFLLYNIPTIVLLGIYFGCREKLRQRKALDKMQALDLE